MGKQLIMCVDDSASARSMVCNTLKAAGFDTIEAVDGKDAMIKLLLHPVASVITDLYMPNMDGLEFIRKVRKSERHRFLPIIMMTSESQRSKVLEAISFGVTGWLLKPVAPDQIVSAIKKVIR